MKITENISDLVLELTELESANTTKRVLRDGGLSLQSLLDIYSETDSNRSRQVVLEIIDEVGSDWGAQLDDSSQYTQEAQALTENVETGYKMLSEDAFMDLLPVNSYFH